jgi:hypothetical protein
MYTVPVLELQKPGEAVEGVAELVGEARRRGGRAAGTAKGLDSGGRPGGGLRGQAVEAALKHGQRLAIGRADPCRFVERRIGGIVVRPSRDPLDQQQELAQLRPGALLAAEARGGSCSVR